MKKIGILFICVFIYSITTTSFAQKDRRLTNGFSINLVTGFPSQYYGLEKDNSLAEEYQLGQIWGVQLGNRWYFSPTDALGVGLMVNWIDFTMGAKGGTSGLIDWGRAVLDITFFEVGPVASIPLTEIIALDGYYNLRPTVFSAALVTTGLVPEKTTYVAAGFGITHAIGAAIRIKAFNFGVEYVTGAVNGAESVTGGDLGIELGKSKILTNSVRFNIGLKL